MSTREAAEQDCEIALATVADIPGILALQEENLPARGGVLSVPFPAEWFAAAIAAMPVVVARRRDRVTGYLVSSPFSAYRGVKIIEAMHEAYPGAADAYVYGPICVAASERRRGVAMRLFGALRAELPGREGIGFIRADNAASLRAHAKMGMHAPAQFTVGGVRYGVVAYIG